MFRDFGTYVTANLVTFTWDEHFRLVEMVLLFCVLIPMSMATFWGLRNTHFSLSMNMHLVCGILFGVDNIRKRSHKLSWILNLPVMVLWLLDRLYSI